MRYECSKTLKNIYLQQSIHLINGLQCISHSELILLATTFIHSGHRVYDTQFINILSTISCGSSGRL